MCWYVLHMARSIVRTLCIGTFCIRDVFRLGRFRLGRFVLGRFVGVPIKHCILLLIRYSDSYYVSSPNQELKFTTVVNLTLTTSLTIISDRSDTITVMILICAELIVMGYYLTSLKTDFSAHANPHVDLTSSSQTYPTTFPLVLPVHLPPIK
jgi:hypothetical protein